MMTKSDPEATYFFSVSELTIIKIDELQQEISDLELKISNIQKLHQEQTDGFCAVCVTEVNYPCQTMRILGITE